jgi:large-conductance mechanosensitive channel
MVVIGFGVASIFSPEFFNTIGNAAKTAGDALGTAFEFILRLFNFVFEAILWILRWIISRLRTNPLEQDGQSGNVSTNPFPQVTPNNWPSAVTETIKWTMLTLIIAAVVYILIRAISRFRDRRARDEIEEIHESLFSWRGLRKDLRELLNMMGKRFQRKEAASAKYHFNESDQGMMDIREIYRHMQWEGGKSGIPRRRHETTGEYQSRLRRRLPEGSEQLEDIVRSYDSVRYGDEKLIDKEYISTNNGWKVIRNLLWRLRGY